MITFTLCLLALIVGYFTYGRLMERVFGPDDRKTPALTKADGVDYIPLPTWKIFMILLISKCFILIYIVGNFLSIKKLEHFQKE